MLDMAFPKLRTEFKMRYFFLEFESSKIKLLLQLRSILEEPISEEEPEPYKMAKMAYKACVDTEALEVGKIQSTCFTLRSRGLD